MKYYLAPEFKKPRNFRSYNTRRKTSRSERPAYEPRREIIAIEPRREVSPRTELKISPETRRLYNIWHEKYESDKLQGRKRKSLPISALERYLATRRAVFVMETQTDPVYFDDSLDKIDVASVSDSWADLDPELRTNNLLFEAPNPTEIRREARLHEREEAQIAKQYEEYLRASN